MIRIEERAVLFSGNVDLATKTRGLELGAPEPAFRPDGERLHDQEGNPIFSARILGGRLEAPPTAELELVARGTAPRSPTIEDGVRAVFERHLGPRQLTQTGESIPAPDAPTCLTLLDLELTRRGDQLDAVRGERDRAMKAHHDQGAALERALWERDRANQELDAFKKAAAADLEETKKETPAHQDKHEKKHGKG